MNFSLYFIFQIFGPHSKENKVQKYLRHALWFYMFCFNFKFTFIFQTFFCPKFIKQVTVVFSKITFLRNHTKKALFKANVMWQIFFFYLLLLLYTSVSMLYICIAWSICMCIRNDVCGRWGILSFWSLPQTVVPWRCPHSRVGLLVLMSMSTKLRTKSNTRGEMHHRRMRTPSWNNCLREASNLRTTQRTRRKEDHKPISENQQCYFESPSSKKPSISAWS